MKTLKGHLIRILMAIVDWRTVVRHFFGCKTKIDVVMISNFRKKFDRDVFLGNLKLLIGHINGPRFWYKKWSPLGISGRLRGIDVLASDIDGNGPRVKEYREKARKFFWEPLSGLLVRELGWVFWRLVPRDYLVRMLKS